MQKNELSWLLETEIPRLATVVDDLMKVNSSLYGVVTSCGSRSAPKLQIILIVMALFEE